MKPAIAFNGKPLESYSTDGNQLETNDVVWVCESPSVSGMPWFPVDKDSSITDEQAEDYANDISIGDMVKDTLEQLKNSTDEDLTESEESQCDEATD